jgi:apolipoprotein D and lipocalin family protein
MILRSLRNVLAALVLSLLPSHARASAEGPDLRTVPYVDLARYMGHWFVISEFPNMFEGGKIASSDTYGREPDGTLQILFKYRSDSLDAPEEQWSGQGWIVNAATNADWKISFVWPFKSRYFVLELDPNYGWAVVSNGSGSIIWVLCRTPAIDEYTYKIVLDRLRARNFDTSRLKIIPQVQAKQ